MTHTQNDKNQPNCTTRQPKTFPKQCRKMKKHKHTSIEINIRWQLPKSSVFEKYTDIGRDLRFDEWHNRRLINGCT